MTKKMIYGKQIVITINEVRPLSDGRKFEAKVGPKIIGWYHSVEEIESLIINGLSRGSPPMLEKDANATFE